MVTSRSPIQLLHVVRVAKHFSPQRSLRLAVSAAALTGAKLAVLFLPFRVAIRIGSIPISRTRVVDDAAVENWVKAVRLASRLLPWRSVCIHEGIALQRLLRSRGAPAILHYGTTIADGKLESHVWVDVGGRTVIGGETASRFRLLASYPPS